MSTIFRLVICLEILLSSITRIRTKELFLLISKSKFRFTILLSVSILRIPSMSSIIQEIKVKEWRINIMALSNRRSLTWKKEIMKNCFQRKKNEKIRIILWIFYPQILFNVCLLNFIDLSWKLICFLIIMDAYSSLKKSA